MVVLELSTVFSVLQRAYSAVKWGISKIHDYKDNNSELDKLARLLEDLKSVFSEFQHCGADAKSDAVQQTLGRLKDTMERIPDFISMSTLQKLNTSQVRGKVDEFHRDLTGQIHLFQSAVQNCQLVIMRTMYAEIQRQTNYLAVIYQNVTTETATLNVLPIPEVSCPPALCALPSRASITSPYSGEYIGYYTYGKLQTDGVTRLHLEFSGWQQSDRWALKVSGVGRDLPGAFVVESGSFDPSSGAITFIKRYVNCNSGVSWLYKGRHTDGLFLGTWGTSSRTLGDFIIKCESAAPVEEDTPAGTWTGYYMYESDGNRKDGVVKMNIVAQRASSGVTISGSGSDGVGSFVIEKGRVMADGSVNFCKKYPYSHSWDYEGCMTGHEMTGTWGKRGTSYGTFLMWKV